VIIELLIRIISNIVRVRIGEDFEPFKDEWTELNNLFEENNYQQVLMRSVKGICGE